MRSTTLYLNFLFETTMKPAFSLNLPRNKFETYLCLHRFEKSRKPTARSKVLRKLYYTRELQVLLIWLVYCFLAAKVISIS